MGKDDLVPYRVRAVRIAVQCAYLILIPLFLYGLLSRGAIAHRVGYFALLSLGSVGVIVVTLLPWKRLLERRLGFALIYGWLVVNVVLITILIALTGGQSSQLVLLYAFTTLFAATVCPLRGQIALFVFTAISYVVGLAIAETRLEAAPLVLEIALLAGFAYLARFLEAELMEQMAERARAKQESERRAQLLATVAAAARNINVLAPDAIFEVAVEAVARLGFEAASLCVLNDDGTTYVPVYTRGLPDDYSRRVYPTTIGLAGRILKEKRTVLVENYSELDVAVPTLKNEGFQAVIGSPISLEGNVKAVLMAGTTLTRRFSPPDVEAFELVAAQANHALENARLYEEQTKNVERLSELDRMKQEFLTTVSHELRTPLTAVEGIGITLASRWENLDEATRHELVELLNANAATLHGIVTTLLDFSTLEAGRTEAEIQPTDLDRLIHDLVQRLQPLLAAHRLDVEVEPDLTAYADPLLLERVIESLLTNAAKYTPEGTRISLAATGEEDWVLVTVADDGPGIEEGDLSRLGETFFRGGDPNERQVRGTGLGLALVRQILSLHDTTLEVESRVGEGSTFSFRLTRLRAVANL